MKPDVEEAIKGLEASGISTGVRAEADSDGGAYVIVDGVAIGSSFEPDAPWIGFHIVWSYPDADVYPHFMDANVRYVGSGPAPNQHAEGNLPTSLSRGATMGGYDLPAIQISRRSNRRSAGTDSALQKLLRIVEFLRTR
ncbi:MAG: hypothetical protein ACR2GO_03810 [Candidatus Limnocylindria bacterium]